MDITPIDQNLRQSGQRGHQGASAHSPTRACARTPAQIAAVRTHTHNPCLQVGVGVRVAVRQVRTVALTLEFNGEHSRVEFCQAPTETIGAVYTAGQLQQHGYLNACPS